MDDPLIRHIIHGTVLAFLLGLHPIPVAILAHKASGSGSITFEQFCYGNGGATDSTVTVTCTNPIGAGHLLYIWNEANHYYGGITVTGDTGTLTADVGYCTDGVDDNNYGYGYYILSTSGGESSIVVNYGTGAGYPQVVIAEFSIPGGATLDVSESGCTGGKSGTATTGSITPSSNGELIIGQANCYYLGALVAASPFTGFYIDASAWSTTLSYYVQPTGAAISTSWSVGSTQTWFSHITAFK